MSDAGAPRSSVDIPRNNPGASGLALQRGRNAKRGMSFRDAHRTGIFLKPPKKNQFDGIPVTDAEIKHLPRKEVDSLLAGELPSTIARSFRPPQYHDEPDEDGPDTPGLLRRESAWKIGDEQGREGETESLLPDSDQRDRKRERLASLALNINTIVNVLLVAAKGVAVLYSSSISLTASLVDSALDLLSTLIILTTSWAIGRKTNAHRYPTGKRRFEPLGVLIFSVAMIASFVQVFIESFNRAREPAGEVVDLSAIGISTMLATIVIKLVLWLWCARIPSSGVQALAQDAENDVFFNVISLAFPVGIGGLAAYIQTDAFPKFVGKLLHWRLLDPIGGMVLSTYIIFEWVKTLLGHFANLSGKVADNDQLSKVLYLVTRFVPVLEIGDVECYHIGDDLIVEIDVILPESSSLHFAHDVGETIQCVIESLDGVLRAYVHCDYSSRNPPQHTSRLGHPGHTSGSSSQGSTPPADDVQASTNHLDNELQLTAEAEGAKGGK
ncbi:hypothetical protein P7C73_g421, partial [Tremellales sp. Uapishka_1]